MSPSSLDSHLVHVIKTYTMQGIPILTHCRGGVGRAGLIACCWVLKLGLCGWIETDLRYRSRRGTNVRAGMVDVDTESGVRRDTMQLVERVIAVVRKRRSVKAVETYEQVKFLVDFVEYLREAPMTSEP
jgi:protein-tyrosine phosphatase